MTVRPHREQTSGQAMVELALVAPLFFMLLLGIIVLGIGVFYQQQITNAAREAARFASVHSATAGCPTVARIDPVGAAKPLSYRRCDSPEDPRGPWFRMASHARGYVFGLDRRAVHFTACWSGYVDSANNPDAPPTDPVTGNPNVYATCTINRIDPVQATEVLSCPPPPTIPSTQPRIAPKADGDDKASNLAGPIGPAPTSTPDSRQVHLTNEVTVYACYVWRPPLAGYLLIPSEIVMRGVVTEVIQRQQ